MESLNASLINVTANAAAQTGAWFPLYGNYPIDGIPVKIRASGGTGTVTFTFEFSQDGATVDTGNVVTTSPALSAVGAEQVIKVGSVTLRRVSHIRARSTAPTTAADVFAGFVQGENV